MPSDSLAPSWPHLLNKLIVNVNGADVYRYIVLRFAREDVGEIGLLVYLIAKP